MLELGLRALSAEASSEYAGVADVLAENLVRVTKAEAAMKLKDK